MRAMKYLFAGLAALSGALCILPAAAQPHYDVKTINFDLWCQEQAKLPPERCDKRLPEDEKKYEAFRDQVERYEIPYLQQKRNEEQIDRTILHNDPVDNPITKNPAAQQQLPTNPGQPAPP